MRRRAFLGLARRRGRLADPRRALSSSVPSRGSDTSASEPPPTRTRANSSPAFATSATSKARRPRRVAKGFQLTLAGLAGWDFLGRLRRDPLAPSRATRSPASPWPCATQDFSKSSFGGPPLKNWYLGLAGD